MDIRLTHSQGSPRSPPTAGSATDLQALPCDEQPASPIREEQFFLGVDHGAHERNGKHSVKTVRSTVTGGGALYLPAVFDTLCHDEEAQRLIYDFSVVQSTLDDVFQTVVEQATESSPKN